ncbi:MAG: Lrp/AsnC ligand binding domain-containing protein [Candidatus Bathyarchaeota archaeon]|nr:Lrp/AsnC ligand binding domain-containing protein [Candidatus Bathyarchaeota archaeon]
MVNMETSVQKYLLMIKLSPNTAAKLYEPLKQFEEETFQGVKLMEAYQIFGQWDFAVLFQADTNADALRFVSESIRLIDGVIETDTIPLVPIRTYHK